MAAEPPGDHRTRARRADTEIKERRRVYDHREINAMAVDDVRARYLAAPDPDRLLGYTYVA